MKALLHAIKIPTGIALLTGVALLFTSCQKELEGSVFNFGCRVQQWADLDSSENATETFDYTYDSATGKPLSLVYNDNVGGNSQTVIPVFSKDTVYFNVGSWAALDNSNRIYRLEERNSVNASVPDGSYFYTYDASGHLSTRIYDDGVTTETTTYTFTGDELTKSDDPLLGIANATTTTYTYSSTVKVKDYNAFIFASAFPELRLYIPCFSFGRFTDKAIEKATLKANIPIPIPEVTITFTNYQFDARGNIIKVQLNETATGVPQTTRAFLSGSYLCR
ncbi:MAG: hypothetical protein V4722_01630 [Bacteroidota bacterium]